MVEQREAGLTEDEKALYDRQIRLWGYEAQWRLKNARVVVLGMDGLGAEIVKNIVLSGVKSVLMWDDKLASSDDFENQFLIPQSSVNVNRAEASKARAQALNPLVLIESDNQPLSEKSDDFFNNFEVIISCNQEASLNARLDRACRKNDTKFIATGVYGTFGYVFYDLQKHDFSKETIVSTWEGNVKKMSMESLIYPSLEEVLNCDINTPEMHKTLRKVPASIFLLKTLLKFEELESRRPLETEDDYTALLKIRNSLLEGSSLPEYSFPEQILRSVSGGLVNPVCAIVGAVVAQEAVVILTKKGQPHHNFFFFNPVRLAGYVQYVGPQVETNSC